ncbi:MAG: hypothetical protein RSB77_01350 [Bacilli bacterium]
MKYTNDKVDLYRGVSTKTPKYFKLKALIGYILNKETKFTSNVFFSVLGFQSLMLGH